MGEFDRIREQLLQKKRELQQRVDKIKSDLRRDSEPLEADFAEQAVQRENDDVLGALRDTARSEIIQIDRALARIEEGQYGRCTRCGEPIQEKRLEVLPYSDLCMNCASGASGDS